MDWQKAEKEGVKAVGGTHHRDSGRGVKKADGDNSIFSFEVKSCARSVNITGAMVDKARKDALQNGRDWAIVVVPRTPYAHKYVVVAKETYDDAIFEDPILRPSKPWVASRFSLPFGRTLGPEEVSHISLDNLDVTVMRVERFNDLWGKTCL